MATLLCQSPTLPDAATAAAAGAPFSSIALFECSIHNAQLLLDSMELADLVLALRIVSQLHGRLVECVEPSASRLIRLANLYSRHSEEIEAKEPDSKTRPQQRPPPPPITKRRNGRSSISNEHFEDALATNNSTISSTSKARRSILSMNTATEKTGTATVADKSKPTTGSSSSAASRASRRQSTSAAAAATAGASKVNNRDSSATRGLSDSWKQLLRKAYRVLQSEGQQLFDFTKSYSAHENRASAEIIISRAVAMSAKPTPDVKSWKNLFTRYLEQWYRKTLKPTHCKSACRVQMSMDKKLNQRRQSLQSLLTLNRLSPATGDRMAALLERDLVSSDEEEPDGCLYVKLLPWETVESARLKSTLDDHFAEELANDREKQELARVRRHPGYVSSRRPPADAPDWAVDKTVGVLDAPVVAAVAADSMATWNDDDTGLDKDDHKDGADEDAEEKEAEEDEEMMIDETEASATVDH